MSSQVDSREIVINMMCVEKGIIPFLGVEANHVSSTLHNMSDEQRRITIRKFRKILKKAIRHEAATWHNTCGSHYAARLEKLSSYAGLGEAQRGPSSKKMSTQQHSLRRTLVARYLSAMASGDE